MIGPPVEMIGQPEEPVRPKLITDTPTLGFRSM